VVDRIGNTTKPGMFDNPEGPVMQPGVTVPAKQQQVTRPVIIR